MKKEHLYSGKCKSIFTSDDPNQVIMHFRDDLTAFDGKKREVCDGKGIYNNYINAFIMDKLAQEGINVSFIKRLNTRESLVRKLEMLKLEFVVRNIAAGGLVKRSGITKGTKLSPPIQELFLKEDKLGDPFINIHYVRTMNLAPVEVAHQAEEISLKINQIMQGIFAAANIDLVDFKLEFGMQDGTLYVGDEISPDSCRLWDKDSKISFDKDLFRFDLGDVHTGYEKLSSMLHIEIPSSIPGGIESTENLY